MPRAARLLALAVPALLAAAALAQSDDAPDGDAGRSGSGTSTDDAGTTSGPGETYDFFANPQPLAGSIGTGRPSFSTGTTAVPVGRFQFETGVSYSRDDHGVAGDFDGVVFPNLLVRAGVLDAVELRLSTAGYVSRDPGADGFADLRLGAKFELFTPADDDPAWLPKIAVQPTLTVPTGSASPNDQLDVAVQLAASWSLSDDVGLLSNLAATTASTGTDTATTVAASLLAARQLGEDTKVFAEVFHQASDSGPDTTSADVGVLHLLTDNVQIDAVLGAGLDREATDLFAGAGLSFRF